MSKKVLYVCEVCGNEFYNYPRYPNPRRFCSRACAKKKRWRKHGESRTRLYQIWIHMKNRCYCKSSPVYDYYGARGIIICDEWLSEFVKFRDWAISNGYQEALEIDRRDVNGNYEPSNCRWATRSQQMRNTRKPKDAITSKYKGVSRNNPAKTWRVQIRKNGTTKYCGSYADEIEAARAYDAIAKVEYGEFCVLNFP